MDTAFRACVLNDAVAWVCGTLLLPPLRFRAIYVAHHRHTQDPTPDPELVPPRPATLRAYAVQMPGPPYRRGQAGMLVPHAA